MAAAIYGDRPVTTLDKVQHLRIAVVGAQRPAVICRLERKQFAALGLIDPKLPEASTTSVEDQNLRTK